MNSSLRNLVFLALSLFISTTSCTHNSSKDPGPAGVGSTEHQQPSLSQTEAQMRARQITDVNYELSLDLSAASEQYSGTSNLQFKVLIPNHELRIDFESGEVLRVEVDGQGIESLYNKRYLVIPGKLLTAGNHAVKIDFRQNYSHEGRGLSRFIDPVDKLTYVTTQFEPYDANLAFPCFDQPDLKATFSLSAKTPKAWEVISAVRESQSEVAGSIRTWVFPRSPRMSTYVFSLHAGPFAKWEDSKFRIPLRLFARKSLAKYVKPEEWFPITRHGFNFFEKYFSTPYPYQKYDQILVPEFNAGAMENVAAVTFTEYFVARGAKQRNQYRGLNITILHEMAHMWFGDLVTMKWWGDLWLNESFATYMSSVALAASPDYPEAWRMFFSGKSGAYYEDQLLTTHPVVAKVRDTQEAFVSFDSITYGKGASVLKQLHFTIGDEAFRAGLKNYFQRFAEKNAEYHDFMHSMAEASGQNLDSWQQSWFETAGVNSLSAQFECRDNKISQFAILQNPVSGQAITRPHSLEIALLQRSKGTVKVADVVRTKISASTTYIAEAIGKACPHAVYPNYNDYAYAKVRLDERTVTALKYSINEVEDPMLRQQFWAGLWDKVRDSELSFKAYADLMVPETLAHESDDLILRSLFNSIFGRANSSLLFYFSQSDKASPSDSAEFTSELEKIVWRRVNKAKAGSDDQMLWYDAFAGAMTSPSGRDYVKRALNGSVKFNGLKLDQDRRWSLVHVLAANNDPEAGKYIAAESKIDNSSKGVEAKIASLAASGSYSEKLKWVAEFKNEKSEYSLAQVRSAIYSLFPRTQNGLRDQFSSQFFSEMSWVNANKSMFYVGLFTALAPWECTEATAGQINQFLNKEKNLLPSVVKNLRNTSQEGERCRKIMALGASGTRFSSP